MSDTQGHDHAGVESHQPQRVDMKFEVAVLPVSDVDRAKRFYLGLGWRLDADFVRNDGSRAVQLTPPGSPASVHLGQSPSFFLVVSDIEAARAELVRRGAAISDVFHRGKEGRVSGPDPERRSYSSWASFSDPDGNNWLLQEVTARLPGRLDANKTIFTSSTELAAALRRAEAAHGEHERRTGVTDPNWPDWYAAFMVAEQTGSEPPS